MENDSCITVAVFLRRRAMAAQLRKWCAFYTIYL